MIYYYDRQGHSISLTEAQDLTMDKDYKRIGYNELAGLKVSTVWIGLDYSINNSHMIFETMVFPLNSYDELYFERYATEQEAMAGHIKAMYLVGTGKIKK